jgi:hypothetical protein
VASPANHSAVRGPTHIPEESTNDSRAASDNSLLLASTIQSRQPVHAKIVSAVERQVVFYRELTNARIGDHAVDLSRMLIVQDLEEVDEALRYAASPAEDEVTELTG